MSIDNDHQPEKLLQAKQFYEDILAVAIQLKQLMESENEQTWPMAAIMELQDERQKIMQRIDELDSVAEMIRYADQKQLTNNVIIEQIRKTVLDIQAVDRNCQAKLEEGKRKTKGKILKIRQNKKAQAAYNQTGNYSSAWFFDKKK